MAPRHLVLLPGLDGTGELFVDFITALPQSLIVTTVVYPRDRFLPYADLCRLVRAAVPQSERFVLLAESFSTPLAISYAATKPQNLAAVVVCAGFVVNPVRGWSGILKALAKPWFFKLRPPRRIVEYFLVGKNAPDLLQRFRRVLKGVSPEVLSRRVREVLCCDARDDLSRTTVPLLYLQATNDKLVSSSCRDDFFHLRTNILLESVPAPHLLLQGEPQKAAELITTFMSKLDASA